MTDHRNGRNGFWALRCGRAASLGLVVLSVGSFDASAQYNAVGRGPSINVGPRMNVTPNLHYSPNNYGGPAETSSYGKRQLPPSGGNPPPRASSGRPSGSPAATPDLRYVARELVIEVAGNPTDAEADALAQTFRLRRVQSQNFPLTGSTIFRWAIPDNRSPLVVARQVATARGVISAQPNYRYFLQQAASGTVIGEGDPAQYALKKLRLSEAHALALGRGVVVAVIDSGIDTDHPEFNAAIASSFDALGSKEGPHPHGTAIAGAIVAHSRLMSSAPSAKLLAIRAFGATSGTAESTSFVILKSLDYAVANGARIVNLSFAGPKDPLLTRGLAAAAGRGIVLIAAAGNAGPKSQPLFPAADPNVIAVSATDASDRLFPASNRGAQIALSAPGTELLLPSVGGKYQIASGTSFSAAYVSGIAALLLERNTALTPQALRTALVVSARDLGPKGRDDSFGAGLADALSALSAVAGPHTAAASPATR